MTKDDPFSSKVNTQGLYQECNFWTLEELAQKGLMNTNKDKMSRKCQGRAYEAVNGVGKYLVHVSIFILYMMFMNLMILWCQCKVEV